MIEPLCLFLAAALVAPTNAVESSVAPTNAAAKAAGSSVTVTAQHADYDRREGVVFFEGKVVAADGEMNLHSNRLYLFLDGTNSLKRIVVLGNVAITNGMRNGSCARAQYLAKEKRIIMFGAEERLAKLVDESSRRSEVVGKKITFYVDSEQVEVEEPVITVEGGDTKEFLPLPGGALESPAPNVL